MFKYACNRWSLLHSREKTMNSISTVAVAHDGTGEAGDRKAYQAPTLVALPVGKGTAGKLFNANETTTSPITGVPVSFGPS